MTIVIKFPKVPRFEMQRGGGRWVEGERRGDEGEGRGDEGEDGEQIGRGRGGGYGMLWLSRMGWSGVVVCGWSR